MRRFPVPGARRVRRRAVHRLKPYTGRVYRTRYTQYVLFHLPNALEVGAAELWVRDCGEGRERYIVFKRRVEHPDDRLCFHPGPRRLVVAVPSEFIEGLPDFVTLVRVDGDGGDANVVGVYRVEPGVR